MKRHDLLTQTQATCQALCRTLPMCCRTQPKSESLWAVGKNAVFQVTVWKQLPLEPLLPTASEVPGVRPLLITEYVEEAVGEQLRRQGICYLDLAGNAWLQHPAASELFVFIQGRPRYRKPLRPGVSFRRDGLRVLFFALTEPQVLHEEDSQLAARVGVTPHILNGVLTDLGAQKLLAYEPRRLVVSPALVAHWAAAYPALRQRLVPQRYRWLDPGKAANWRNLYIGRQGAWGGEAAAQLLLGEDGDQPSRLIIYSAEDRDNLCTRLGLKPHPHGSVELLRPFTEPFAAPHLPAACVHPLVVYADLLLLETAPATRLAHLLAKWYLADLIPAAFPPGEALAGDPEAGQG